MKDKAFESMREQAVLLFNGQPAKPKERISLDTIFLSLALAVAVQGSAEGVEKRAQAKPETRTGRDAPAEEWFRATLAKLKDAGEKDVTIERFLLVAGRFPLTRMDRINAARWLREAGHIPRKTGGNLIFDL